jgi:hypothetical protein
MSNGYYNQIIDKICIVDDAKELLHCYGDLADWYYCQNKSLQRLVDMKNEEIELIKKISDKDLTIRKKLKLVKQLMDRINEEYKYVKNDEAAVKDFCDNLTVAVPANDSGNNTDNTGSKS